MTTEPTIPIRETDPMVVVSEMRRSPYGPTATPAAR